MTDFHPKYRHLSHGSVGILLELQKEQAEKLVRFAKYLASSENEDIKSQVLAKEVLRSINQQVDDG